MLRPVIAQGISRIIGKYESEWGGNMNRWNDLTPMMRDGAPRWQKELERIEKLQIWADLADVDGGRFPGPTVYHIHPIGIIGNFMTKGCCEITVEFLEKILNKKGDWFTGKGGGRAFQQTFPTNYPDIYKFEKKRFVDLLNAKLVAYGITECYQKAHFISQCYVESASFETTIEFADGTEYDPGVHPDAVKNGNTVVGDGPRYRGRGLIQLTWKNNYKAYSDYTGKDFVANYDSLERDMENSIDVACWFWRHNGGIKNKYNANGDINVLVDNEKENVTLITLAVNGGRNGLSTRQDIFNKIKTEWSLV